MSKSDELREQLELAEKIRATLPSRKELDDLWDRLEDMFRMAEEVVHQMKIAKGMM